MSPTRARARKTSRSKKEEAAAKPARPFTAHHLVPPHEILSAEETTQTLAILGTAPERLPKILANDPGLRTDPKYEKLREVHEPLGGRLVRIRRPSATAGEAIAYRLLVEHPGD